MGFFQSLFHKNQTKKEQIVSTIPTLPTPNINHQPTTQSVSPHIPTMVTSTSTSTTQSKPSSASNSVHLLSRTSLEKTSRFQTFEDGSHAHHLTLPAQNRIAASLNGLVTGLAHRSLKWTERKVTVEELQKERQALSQRLHRSVQDLTLTEKYGVCQETIGKGTSGVVKVARKTNLDGTEELYAVKELRKKQNESSKDYVNRLTAEFCIASSMEHLNIIRTFDILPLHETSPIFCQVMEYTGAGDLFDVLYDCPDGLAVAEANCFFKQLIHGVHYLHEAGVAHRDLKPENLLVTTQGCIKISDFGSAACFRGTAVDSEGELDEAEDVKGEEVHLIRGLVGSEPYIAPEVFIEKDYDARALDVWSCAIVYMALRKANHLWHVAKQGEDEAYDRYLKFRQLLDEERENARREHQMRRVLEKTMSQAERERERLKREAGIIKAKETIRKRAKESRFETLDGIDIQAKRVIYRMLDPNPKKRITTPEIIQSDWFKSIDCCQKPY